MEGLNQMYEKFRDEVDSASRGALIRLALGRFDLPFGGVKVCKSELIPDGKNVFLVMKGEIYCNDPEKFESNKTLVIFPVPLPENAGAATLAQWADECVKAWYSGQGGVSVSAHCPSFAGDLDIKGHVVRFYDQQPLSLH